MRPDCLPEPYVSLSLSLTHTGFVETLRIWVKQSAIDAGKQPNLSNEECEEVRRPSIES